MRFAHALAGLIDAEGSFTISPSNRGRSWRCWMRIALRDDDADILIDVARTTGLGRLNRIAARPTSRPQLAWNIASKRECSELVALLRRHPLRARKRHDFEIWWMPRRTFIGSGVMSTRLHPRGAGRLTSCWRTSAGSSRAKAASGCVAPIERDDDARETYAEVLRAFAVESDSLSSNAYVRVRARHPGWPTRNTIAVAFGSWAAAVEAAGLR